MQDRIEVDRIMQKAWAIDEGMDEGANTNNNSDATSSPPWESNKIYTLQQFNLLLVSPPNDVDPILMTLAKLPKKELTLDRSIFIPRLQIEESRRISQIIRNNNNCWPTIRIHKFAIHADVFCNAMTIRERSIAMRGMRSVRRREGGRSDEKERRKKEVKGAESSVTSRLHSNYLRPLPLVHPHSNT
jgi:hypothetical protein